MDITKMEWVSPEGQELLNEISKIEARRKADLWKIGRLMGQLAEVEGLIR